LKSSITWIPCTTACWSSTWPSSASSSTRCPKPIGRSSANAWSRAGRSCCSTAPTAGHSIAWATASTSKSAAFELLEIRLDHPWAYSQLAYRAYLACEGVRRRWVFLDCFTHQNPRTNVRTGLPGLWLPFNTTDALEGARAFLKGKRFERIYLALVPSIPPAPDTAPLERWRALLAEHGADVRLVGVSPRRYPADPLAPFCFMADVKGLRRRLARRTPLTLERPALRELVKAVAGGAEVRYGQR